MTVQFQELSGSPEEKYSMTGFSATRKLLCAWSDRNALVRELLGDNEEFAGNTAATYPNRSDIRVTDIDIVPFEKNPNEGVFTDVATELNAYSGQQAQLTVSYQWMLAGSNALPNPRSIDVEPDTFLTYTRKLGGEYITLPGLKVKWLNHPDSPIPKDALPDIRIPIIEHNFTWSRVNKPPETAMAAALGKINAVEWNGYAEHTLLFEGGSMKRELVGFPDNDPVAGGQGSLTTWEVGYVFRERIIKFGGNTFGWQATWLADDDISGYDFLVTPDGKGMYREASTEEFDALFKDEVTT